MRMRHAVAVSGLVLMPLTSARTYAQAASGSSSDMMTIDGTKNPELIPQWSVWAAGAAW
jgi:hypothetical protein